MVRLNDIELETHLRKLHKFHSHIDRQTRDGLESALFLSLMEIEQAARAAQSRLNELKYGKHFVAPEEQMGT